VRDSFPWQRQFSRERDIYLHTQFKTYHTRPRGCSCMHARTHARDTATQSFTFVIEESMRTTVGIELHQTHDRTSFYPSKHPPNTPLVTPATEATLFIQLLLLLLLLLPSCNLSTSTAVISTDTRFTNESTIFPGCKVLDQLTKPYSGCKTRPS
jgi:hypothetical protein